MPGIMADGMQPYLETIEHLNVIQERPFVEENCTMFVERAFGKRRMFADSPTGRSLAAYSRDSEQQDALRVNKRRGDCVCYTGFTTTETTRQNEPGRGS